MRRDSELYRRGRERVDAVWSSDDPESITPEKRDFMANLEGFAPVRQRPVLAPPPTRVSPPVVEDDPQPDQ